MGRGALWGAVLGIPAGLYCCFTMPYGAGFVAGPIAALAGPIAGAWLAFHIGAAVGLRRAGYPWMILLVVALAAAAVLTPWAIYRSAEQKEAETRRLVHALENDDPRPVLAALKDTGSRALVEEHLAQFLVCAGAHSPPEVVDALASLDPRGKDGYALCAAVLYPRIPTVAHLLAEGFSPRRAHRIDGPACDPLLELAEGSRSTPPCSPDSEQFAGMPTVEGCAHRLEVAKMLLDAGATPGVGSAFEMNGCQGDGGAGPANWGAWPH